MNDLDRIRDDDGKLPSFAWPGGYPIVYFDRYGMDLCPNCANDADCDPPPIAYDVHFEGADFVCENCNKKIPSAYGDPEEEAIQNKARESIADALMEALDITEEEALSRAAKILEAERDK